MKITKKQENEKLIAEKFLGFYNSIRNTNFEIITLSDTPDVFCEDRITGEKLNLELSFLEDLPNQYRYFIGKGPKPRSATTGTTDSYSLFDDVIPNFRKSIQAKLLSSYGANTALVFYQVSPLWERIEWEIIRDRFLADFFEGYDKNYGAGIWIIFDEILFRLH